MASSLRSIGKEEVAIKVGLIEEPQEGIPVSVSEVA